jgi:hypothetical protein
MCASVKPAPHTLRQADAFVKCIPGKMFDKIYSACLQQIYFGAELNLLRLPAANCRTDIRPVYAHCRLSYLFALKAQALPGIDFPYGPVTLLKPRTQRGTLRKGGQHLRRQADYFIQQMKKTAS